VTAPHGMQPHPLASRLSSTLRPSVLISPFSTIASTVSGFGRCAPSEPGISFTLPGEGVRLRGDIEFRLYATGGLLSADELLGWVTLHTSWMPEVVHRSDMDSVSKDGRFPADWQLKLICEPSSDEHQ